MPEVIRAPGLSKRRLMASDRLSSLQVLGHLKVMPKGGQGLAGPILELRIFAALGVAFEQ
jgi:hypothetical protein